MAITPNSYPFSGGAFMGGGGSPVNRDDIHTLNLTKNGESIGNYNPLVGDADVDIPSDAVVISFSTLSGTMPGSAYSKMASAVGAGQVVMLRSVSGASVVYWTFLAASALSYKFISVSETAVLTVEIQTSGDSSGNHAFTISNVPLTELRVIDTGASSGDDRGHEHTRIAEALAAGKTVCIKYTSGNNIAYGTLCGAHDGHYTFIVDYGGTPSVLTVIADGSMQIASILNGDGSEITATFSTASTRTNIASGEKLSVLFGKIAKWLGDLGTAAFKTLVTAWSGTTSNDNIPSEKLVKDSLDGKADKASITGATKCKITYNSQGIVTAGADLGASDIPDLPASKTTSGTFDAARIPTIWPDKMPFGRAYYAASTTGYKNVALIRPPSANNGDWLVSFDVYEFNANGTISYRGFINIGCRRDGSTYSYKAQYFGYQLASCSLVVRYSGNTHNTLVYVGKTNSAYCSVVVVPKRGGDYDGTFDYSNINLINDPSTEDISSYYDVTIVNTYIPSNPGKLVAVNGQIGSPTTPVYVDSDGKVQPCDVLSGGTTNFNKIFTWTYTVNQNNQYIAAAVINENINYIAEYVEWHNANFGKLTHPPLIILSVSARTDVANAGLIKLNMYKNGNGCDVFGEKYAYMGNQHGSQAYNTQYFTDQPFVSGSAYYLDIRNETSNTMWTAGTILDISIRIVAHAVSVT